MNAHIRPSRSDQSLEGAPKVKSYFRNTVTIDPAFSVDAWRRLETNTRAIEVADLPRKLHEGLIRSLTKSRFASPLHLTEK